MPPAPFPPQELTALGEAVGAVSKGLVPEAIARLPGCDFSQLHSLHAPRGQTDRCCVCCCEFESEDAVTLLKPCDHVFHAPCIGQWLGINKVCPVCNVEVAPPATAAQR